MILVLRNIFQVTSTGILVTIMETPTGVTVVTHMTINITANTMEWIQCIMNRDTMDLIHISTQKCTATMDNIDHTTSMAFKMRKIHSTENTLTTENMLTTKNTHTTLKAIGLIMALQVMDTSLLLIMAKDGLMVHMALSH